jgi:hypothetical protein
MKTHPVGTIFSNGSAYVSTEVRHGVSLSYVSEKLRSAIVETNALARGCPQRQRELSWLMRFQVSAYLALHNSLEAANDLGLVDRLLLFARASLDQWFDSIDQGVERRQSH